MDYTQSNLDKRLEQKIAVVIDARRLPKIKGKQHFVKNRIIKIKT